MAKYHDIYKFVCDGLLLQRTIQRYRVKYGKYYEILLQKTLEKASELDFTKFNHVAIDGTIIKAHNSNQNMISKKETRLLIQYYKGITVNEDKINNLNKPAKKKFSIIKKWMIMKN